MSKRVIPAVLALLLSGCLDGLGIGSGCEEEMHQVRRRHGAPDQQARGLRSEIWLYGRSPDGFYYEFSWGSAGEPCEVVGPVSQSLMSDRGASLIFEASGDAEMSGHRPSFRGGKTR
jgi:hypothetical protein